MTQSSQEPIGLSGLGAISDRFDAAILDQWGVLHDGAKAPAGAIDAVAAMVAAGKRLVVLSNSARPGSDAQDRLVALGYSPAFFAGVVTSGQTVRDMLRDRIDPFFDGLGRSVFLIARDDALIKGLDYRIAESPKAADFVLLGSSTAPELSLRDNHAPALESAAALGLPLICANPDRVGVAAASLIEGPGALAAYYESLGGTTRFIGKPYREVYAKAFDLLKDIPAFRILAVGDSMEHDIAGGIKAGCQTAFVTAGIHVADLAVPDGLSLLRTRYGVTPDFIVSRLLW